MVYLNFDEFSEWSPFVTPEATNINCIKSLQVHGLGQNCSVKRVITVWNELSVSDDKSNGVAQSE